jgi:hypothetical protein
MPDLDTIVGAHEEAVLKTAQEVSLRWFGNRSRISGDLGAWPGCAPEAKTLNLICENHDILIHSGNSACPESSELGHSNSRLIQVPK